MSADTAPKSDQALYGSVTITKGIFVFVGCMKIELNRQPMRQNHIDGAIQARRKIRIQPLLAERALLKLHRINAQTNIVEAQPRYQRDVAIVDIGTRVKTRITVRRLREPSGQINTPLEVLGSSKGGLRVMSVALALY
jgi:hypothetical protein